MNWGHLEPTWQVVGISLLQFRRAVNWWTSCVPSPSAAGLSHLPTESSKQGCAGPHSCSTEWPVALFSLTGCTSVGSWSILLKPMFLLTQANKEEDLNISRAQSCLRSESNQLGSMGDSTNQQKFSQNQGGQPHSARGPGKRGVPDNDFRYGVEDPPLFLAHKSKMPRERCPVCLRGKQLSFEHWMMGQVLSDVQSIH